MKQFRLNKGRKERRGTRDAITRLSVKFPGELKWKHPSEVGEGTMIIRIGRRWRIRGDYVSIFVAQPRITMRT